MTIAERSQVRLEETWNLDDLFPDDEAWEAARAAIEAEIPGLERFRGRLGESAATLRDCLDAQEALNVRLVRVGTFSHLRNAADGRDPANQARHAKVEMLRSRIAAATSFVASEIAGLPDGSIERFLASEPGLEAHRRDLEFVLETKRYRLHPEAERALAALGEVFGAPYRVYDRTKSSDMRFEAVEDGEGTVHPVSFNTYQSDLERSPDPVLRRRASESFAKGLSTHRNGLAAAYSTELRTQVVAARLRGWASTTDMLLSGQRVERRLYELVHDAILADLPPIMRRWARLVRRVLGLDRLHACDLKAPLERTTPRATWAEGVELIASGLAVLGPEYGRIVRRALAERWVDRANNLGKSSGAFCSTPYGVHAYILITWADTLRDVFTLAHELGHAGHLMLAGAKQRYVNTRPSLFFIEAPSTLNELLLGRSLLAATNDPSRRRWVISQILGTYFHNFVTHLLEAELQRRLYAMAEADRPITATLLDETQAEVLRSFWGDELEIDEGARLTWMRQPHYYMGLYPYTYAAGLSAATAVAQAIEVEGPPAVARWLRTLEAGGTRRPLELLELAGVDLSTDRPIRQAVAYVGALVGELESLF